MMLKIRITYEDQKELNDALEILQKEFKVLFISKVYKGRGYSRYSNVYLDIENK